MTDAENVAYQQELRQVISHVRLYENLRFDMPMAAQAALNCAQETMLGIFLHLVFVGTDMKGIQKIKLKNNLKMKLLNAVDKMLPVATDTCLQWSLWSCNWADN